MRCVRSRRGWQVWALLCCAAGSLACNHEPAAKPVVCPPAPPAPACPAPAPAPAQAAQEPPSPSGGEDSGQPGIARFYPGPDSARSPRTRRPNVVILFAPPAQPVEDATLSTVEKLRLQPIVCVLAGKLATGARCGEAMPARTKVRLTEAGSSLGLEEVDVERSTVAFHDRNGQHDYPAPYGPACCMYNTCVGKTVPYYPKLPDSQSALVSTKTVLAVWPVDAELDLTVFQPGLPAELSVDKAPWTSVPCQRSPACLVQAAQAQGRSFASIKERLHGAGLFAFTGSGPNAKSWQPLLGDQGAREYYVLAASDLDRDGRPELLVYARWANDYALHLFANDAAAPLYDFSCGNI